MALGPFHTIVLRSIPLPIFVLAGVFQFFIGPALYGYLIYASPYALAGELSASTQEWFA
jgi:hypothetical protein